MEEFTTMDDNNVVVEELRQSNRYAVIHQRKRLRDDRIDRHRSSLTKFLFNSNSSSVNVEELANKLKSKTTLSVVDLMQLKNVILDNKNNIQIVLNKEGGLRGLVREVSGTNWQRQVEAAGCLCNLALGDERACLVIMKAAGAYLIAQLDSHNIELVSNCAWALGNLCGSGLVVSRMVSAAGGVAKLCEIATRMPLPAEPPIYALTFYTSIVKNELSKEHLEMIVSLLTRPGHCPDDFRLHYNLTCHKDFSDPEQLMQGQIIQNFPQLIHQHRMSCYDGVECSLLFAIRALANVEGASHYADLLATIVALDDPALVQEFFSLVEDNHLRKSMKWLLGNMLFLEQRNKMIPGLAGKGIPTVQPT